MRAKWHRRFYRLSGLLVIIGGAALPVLTSLDCPGKTVVISLAVVLVAGLTGLRAFYRWDQSWILLRNTEMAVTGAYLAWKMTPGNLPSTKDEVVTPEQEKAAQVFIEKLGRSDARGHRDQPDRSLRPPRRGGRDAAGEAPFSLAPEAPGHLVLRVMASDLSSDRTDLTEWV